MRSGGASAGGPTAAPCEDASTAALSVSSEAVVLVESVVAERWTMDGVRPAVLLAGASGCGGAKALTARGEVCIPAGVVAAVWSACWLAVTSSSMVHSALRFSWRCSGVLSAEATGSTTIGTVDAVGPTVG